MNKQNITITSDVRHLERVGGYAYAVTFAGQKLDAEIKSDGWAYVANGKFPPGTFTITASQVKTVTLTLTEKEANALLQKFKLSESNAFEDALYDKVLNAKRDSKRDLVLAAYEAVAEAATRHADNPTRYEAELRQALANLADVKFKTSIKIS